MWGHLLERALAGAPARLAALDRDERALASLRRLAGRRAALQLPPRLAPVAGAFGRAAARVLGAEVPEVRAPGWLVLEFSAEGALSVRAAAELPQPCEFSLRFSPWRLEGNRTAALRLLAAVRRYRPDLEEWLEFWFGPGAAGGYGLAADAADSLKEVVRPGQKPAGEPD